MARGALDTRLMLWDKTVIRGMLLGSFAATIIAALASLEQVRYNRSSCKSIAFFHAASSRSCPIWCGSCSSLMGFSCSVHAAATATVATATTGRLIRASDNQVYNQVRNRAWYRVRHFRFPAPEWTKNCRLARGRLLLESAQTAGAIGSGSSIGHVWHLDSIQPLPLGRPVPRSSGTLSNQQFSIMMMMMMATTYTQTCGRARAGL